MKRLRDGWMGLTGAALALAATATIIGLESSVREVRRYTTTHAFTSSVVAGVLVLLLTVLIVDRALRIRELKNRSRVIAVQAAIIVSQAHRAATAITASSPSDEHFEQAVEELRTFAQMLLTSAPVLIEADAPRQFLEAAQAVAAQLFKASRAPVGAERRRHEAAIARAVKELRAAAAPLVAVLDAEQRAAVSSGSSTEA